MTFLDTGRTNFLLGTHAWGEHDVLCKIGLSVDFGSAPGAQGWCLRPYSLNDSSALQPDTRLTQRTPGRRSFPGKMKVLGHRQYWYSGSSDPPGGDAGVPEYWVGSSLPGRYPIHHKLVALMMSLLSGPLESWWRLVQPRPHQVALWLSPGGGN